MLKNQDHQLDIRFEMQKSAANLSKPGPHLLFGNKSDTNWIRAKLTVM